MFLEASAAIIFSLIIGIAIGRFTVRANQDESELQAVELTRLQKVLQEKEAEIEEQRITIQEQQTQMAVLEEKRVTFEREQAILKDEITKAESELEAEKLNLSERLQTLSACEAKLLAMSEQNDERNTTIEQLKTDNKAEREKTEVVEQERNGLKNELSSLKASLDEERKHAAEQLALLKENKETLKQEFELLSQKIFKTSSENLSTQNKESMNFLLKPLKEQLDGFRKRVDDVHTHQTAGNAALKAELDKLFTLNQRITDEAANLTKALTNDKKTQGNWGELQVEMILDQSGLQKGNEYEREANFKDDEDNNKRPDFIVHLPEGKHVIIDSKVSLVDYNRYVAAENDVERQQALEQHVKAIKNHISSLSEKGYPKLKNVQSPDFVFMFMPIEPAFLVAFHYDQNLFNTAFEKRIVVVTPSTLLATLRTVSSLWSIERQNQSARTLADQAGKVYDKLRVFVEKMDKLDSQLSTARNTFDDAQNTLIGSRSLTSTVQKFVDLGVRVKKELPASVKESSMLDDETVLSIENEEVIKD